MAGTDAETLIRDTLALYQGLSSYRDEGFVDIRGKDRESIQRTTFKTHFLRPSFFRFEFSSPHPYRPLSHIVTTCVCGFDGSRAYLWTRHYDDPAKIQEYGTFTMAVAGATGISYGSAHTIAQLLVEGFDEHAFSSLSNPVLGDDEVIEGEACKSGTREARSGRGRRYAFRPPRDNDHKATENRLCRVHEQ